LDKSGIQKDRFYTRVVYKRIDFRPELYTTGQILYERGIQKDRFSIIVVYKRIDFRRAWYTKG
jgi:hypothetical protein